MQHTNERKAVGLGIFWVTFVALTLYMGAVGRVAAADETNTAFSVGSLFEARRFEATLASGVLFSPLWSQVNRPTINYTITALQLGYMLSNVKGKGLLRGNFELAGEAFGSKIFQGPGSYVAGGTLWIRYNFVPTGGRLVPYIEGGAGLTSTDIDRQYVGQPFNFNLEFGVGARFFVARNWSINLEFRFQHLSNADTGNRNVGVNAGGPLLGVSYLF